MRLRRTLSRLLVVRGHCGLCGGSLRGDSDKGARRRTKVDIIVRQSLLPEGVQGLDAGAGGGHRPLLWVLVSEDWKGALVPP